MMNNRVEQNCGCWAENDLWLVVLGTEPNQCAYLYIEATDTFDLFPFAVVCLTCFFFLFDHFDCMAQMTD